MLMCAKCRAQKTLSYHELEPTVLLGILYVDALQKTTEASLTQMSRLSSGSRAVNSPRETFFM